MMMNHHTTSTMRPLQCSDAKSSSSLSSTSSVSHEECTLSIDSHVDIDRDFVMVSCAVLCCANLLLSLSYDMLVTIATESHHSRASNSTS